MKSNSGPGHLGRPLKRRPRPTPFGPAEGLPDFRRRRLLKACAAVLTGGVLVPAAGLRRAGAQPAGPAPGRLALGPGDRFTIDPGDRCPVCGMRPIRYPEFSCALQLTDGRTYYFCSAGCLLQAWLHPQQLLALAADRLARVVVREYFSGRPVSGDAVTWVAGSDVAGPMGPAIVALAGDRHVAAFRRRHGGRFVFRLSELNEALWHDITGRAAGR